jgi:transcription elongation factor Elf1
MTGKKRGGSGDMPSCLYCSECKSFSIEFDPKSGVATCTECGKKVTPQVRNF